jgi:hypothetical protein
MEVHPRHVFGSKESRENDFESQSTAINSFTADQTECFFTGGYNKWSIILNMACHL